MLISLSLFRSFLKTEQNLYSQVHQSNSIITFGLCCLDYIVYLDSYPSIDSKVRSQSFHIEGGGNCGNVSCALSRLQINVRVISKLGFDIFGQFIRSQLEKEKVDLSYSHISSDPKFNSPFSYIIVSGKSRTCVHTPISNESEEFVVDNRLFSQLQNTKLVYFDCRFIFSAINFARKLASYNIKILLDLEKIRPRLEQLIDLSNYIVTNSDFPSNYTKSERKGDLLQQQSAILQRHGNLEFIITTLGQQGCVMMLKRKLVYQKEVKKLVTDSKLLQKVKIEYFMYNNSSVISLPIPTNQSNITQSNVSDSNSNNNNNMGKDQGNQILGNSSENMKLKTVGVDEEYNVIKCSAVKISKEKILDTTGAGDSFIAGVIYGLVNNFSIERMLAFGSLIAHKKIKHQGARSGLPYFDQIQKYIE